MIKFNKLKPDAQIPTRTSAGSAGYDLHIYEDVTFHPGEYKLLSTHISVDMPDNIHMQLHARSSLYPKRGFEIPNAPGIIDSDYTDAILIPLVNRNNIPMTLKKGDRVAQGIFVPYVLTAEDNATGDRLGGFGSSGR